MALNSEKDQTPAPDAIEWPARMADRFDLEATILADPDNERGFEVVWWADEDPIGNRRPSSERT